MLKETASPLNGFFILIFWEKEYLRGTYIDAYFLSIN